MVSLTPRRQTERSRPVVKMIFLQFFKSFSPIKEADFWAIVLFIKRLKVLKIAWRFLCLKKFLLIRRCRRQRGVKLGFYHDLW